MPTNVNVIELSSNEVDVVQISLDTPTQGGNGQVFEHVQTVPSNVWTINHNLGFEPIVQVRDVTGNLLITDVRHVSINQIQITFAVATAGSVRCV